MAAKDLAAEGRVRSQGGRPAASMRRKERRARDGRALREKEEIRADQEVDDGKGRSRKARREKRGREQRE